jgi:hypothetical protein
VTHAFRAAPATERGMFEPAPFNAAPTFEAPTVVSAVVADHAPVTEPLAVPVADLAEPLTEPAGWAPVVVHGDGPLQHDADLAVPVQRAPEGHPIPADSDHR